MGFIVSLGGGVDEADADEEGAGEGTGYVGASFMKSLLDGEAEGLSEEGQGGRHQFSNVSLSSGFI
jgi:hypothetical protein